MKRKDITDIIKKRFQKLNSISADILVSFKSEDIHQFRVQAKKLFSLLRLMKAGSKHLSSWKMPKRLKEFYKVLGVIRVSQIQQEKIKRIARQENEAPPATYLNMLRMQAASNMIIAEDLMKYKKDFNKEKKSILKKIPGKMSSASIKKFIQKELDQLDFLLSTQKTDESLHNDRKLLKDILFTLSYVGNNIESVLPLSLAKNNYIKEMTDLLGEFHDLSTGLNLLDPGSLDKIYNENELILLMNIKKQWEEERDNSRRQIFNEFAQLHLMRGMVSEQLAPAYF
ncbi:MAG: CHAD domain-containing protein [Bacteroidetes bacterium]|nr:CHAD domain-containing protein [Bacteroidota bacterium]